jgi:CheY-like chemotaxis protein
MNPLTVLIVEDHPLVAKFFRLALERAGGFQCLVTEDVPEILKAVQSGSIQVAIVDVSLANSEWEGKLVSGVEVVRLIKACPSPPPVLLATAHAMAGDRERLLDASGADAYLEKPVYDADQLVAQVRALVEQ